MIDLGTIANSTVVNAQHRVNKAMTAQNTRKMEQESGSAPSNIVQKLTIPQLVAYMQNSNEATIRKLFNFLSKEQLDALKRINNKLEDEEIQEMIANYSAPDDAFDDDFPDDASQGTIDDTPDDADFSDIEFDDISDDTSSDDVDEFEAIDATSSDVVDEFEVSDDDFDELSDDFDTQMESFDTLEDIDDIPDGIDDIPDGIDDVPDGTDDSTIDEGVALAQGTTSDIEEPVASDEPENVAVPIVAENLKRLEVSDDDSAFDDFDDVIDEEDSDSEMSETSSKGTIFETEVGAISSEDVNMKVEDDFNAGDIDDVEDLDEFDEVDADFINSEDEPDVVDMAEEKVNIPQQAIESSDSTPDMESIGAEDEFDDILADDTDSDEAFDDFEDDSDDVEDSIDNLTDDFDDIADDTANSEDDTSDFLDDVDAPSFVAAVPPAQGTITSDEAPAPRVANKSATTQSSRKTSVEIPARVVNKTRHVEDSGEKRVAISDRKSVSSTQMKKAAQQSEYASAIKGITGLGDLSDLDSIISEPVSKPSKPRDVKPAPKVANSSRPAVSSGTAKVTLSRDPSIPEPTVGELYEKGWTLMTYMSKNRGNKAAMHLDVVCKYFPMAVIKAGEARGKFTIHKNYLRK